MLRHFSERGVGTAKLRGALEDALKSFDQSTKDVETEAHKAMRGRIDTLATWHRETRFLDDVGKPRVVSLQDSPSLGEVFDRHLPNEQSKGLAEGLANQGGIRRASRNDWLPRKRTLIVSSDSFSPLPRLPGQIDSILSTLLQNRRTKGSASRHRRVRVRGDVRIPRIRS